MMQKGLTDRTVRPFSNSCADNPAERLVQGPVKRHSLCLLWNHAPASALFKNRMQRVSTIEGESVV